MQTQNGQKGNLKEQHSSTGSRNTSHNLHRYVRGCQGDRVGAPIKLPDGSAIVPIKGTCWNYD